MDQTTPAKADHPFERKIDVNVRPCRKDGCEPRKKATKKRQFLHNVYQDCNGTPIDGGQGLYDPMAVESFRKHVSDEGATTYQFGNKLKYKSKGDPDVKRGRKRLAIQFASWEETFEHPMKYTDPGGKGNKMEMLQVIGAPLYVKEIGVAGPHDFNGGAEENRRGLWAATRILKSIGFFKKIEEILAVHVQEPENIQRIVCFDMGELGETPNCEEWEGPPCWGEFVDLLDVYTKHAVAILIAEYLNERFHKHKESFVDIYTQDENYTEWNKEALAEFDIRVVDSPDGQLLVDENTLVIAPSGEISKEVICDMAQPFMMIWPTEEKDTQIPPVRHRMTEYSNIHTFNARLEATENDLAGWMQLCSWYKRRPETRLQVKRRPIVQVPRLPYNSRWGKACKDSACVCTNKEEWKWKANFGPHWESLGINVVHKVFGKGDLASRTIYPWKNLKELYGKTRQASSRFIYHRGYYFPGPKGNKILGSSLQPTFAIYPWNHFAYPQDEGICAEVAKAFIATGLPVRISWEPQQPPNGDVGVERLEDANKLKESIEKWKSHPRLNKILTELRRMQPRKIVAIGLGEMDIKSSRNGSNNDPNSRSVAEQFAQDGDIVNVASVMGAIPAPNTGKVIPTEGMEGISPLLDLSDTGSFPKEATNSPEDNHHMHALLILMAEEMRKIHGKYFRCYAQDRMYSESTVAILRGHGVDVAKSPEGYLLADRRTFVISWCYANALPIVLGMTRPIGLMSNNVHERWGVDRVQQDFEGLGPRVPPSLTPWSRKAHDNYERLVVGLKDETMVEKRFLFDRFLWLHLYRRQTR